MATISNSIGYVASGHGCNAAHRKALGQPMQSHTVRIKLDSVRLGCKGILGANHP